MMIRVLFVCLGNICRSPLAEGIFRRLVKEKGLEGSVECDSAGMISAHAGELPDIRTRKNATFHDLELTHRSTLFKKSHFEEFDYILAMDESNLRQINQLRKVNKGARIFLMRQFDTIHKGSAVPDPYYGDETGFEEVYQILDRSCRNLLTFIAEEHHLTHETP